MALKKNLLALIFLPFICNAELLFEQQHISENNLQITVLFNLKPNELLYKDSLIISVDQPNYKITHLQSNPEATYRFDEVTKQKKLVYPEKVTFSLQIIKLENDHEDAALHIMYQTNINSAPQHQFFKLNTATPQLPISSETTEPDAKQFSSNKPEQKSERIELSTKLWQLSQSISSLLQHSHSLPMQLIFVFLLGSLLSLTPCIYPMIPITIGILQNQKGPKTFISTFARACSYTMGVATTFATLGFVTSYTGFAAGSLLIHPLFVIPLVSLLGYLAFSMFGFYEMYVPRFMQNTQRTADGSLFSAFLFGAASGTIASPCVSPGLALVLSMAALSGSALIGFLLLFVFGVGLSTPLLIVGTFSNSLNLLPQSGMWMLEIKKFFGLLLLLVCFYYLTNIMPLYIVLMLMAVTFIIIGIYYVYEASKTHPGLWKKINTIMGMFFIIGSIAALPHAYFVKFSNELEKASIWKTDYATARQVAIKEHKKLFIDFWAQYCSICKAINKTVLADPVIVEKLQQFIPVMIDGTNENNDVFKIVKEKFAITGFPTFIVVDPETETILKKWGSELYHMPCEEFLDELEIYAPL